jgi:lauroyl/myristoyl acyltransferase
MSLAELPKPPFVAPSVAPIRLVSGTDLAVLAGLPVLTALAWLVPERRWPGVSRALAPIYAPMPEAKVAERGERVRRFLESEASMAEALAPEDIVREIVARKIESVLQYLRHCRPGGWQPAIRVTGAEQVAAGLEGGRGVILWVSQFVHHSLVAKMAFHQAAIPVSHLSHPRHGFSGSRFCMAVLNRVQTRVEDRFLEARVMLGLDDSAAAMAELRRCLGANGVVTITVRDSGRRPVEVPFGGGRIRLAVGGANLAHTTGAALLPVFPVREADGAFRVAIEPAIAPAIAQNHGGERGPALAAAAAAYAERLEGYVARYPGQWTGWSELVAPGAGRQR